MTVSLEADAIILSGTCGVEEVELLVDLLEAGHERSVDLGGATSVHTALWQALMVFRPRLTGNPTAPEAKMLLSGLFAYLEHSDAMSPHICKDVPSK